MKRLAIALISSTLAFPASAETITGAATVIDGDTLEVDGRRVRLFGIDAPELGQTCVRDGAAWACGHESARQLRALVGSDPVYCRGDEVDQFARLLAVCSTGSLEPNRAMVAEGGATAFRQYSQAYVADETRARASRQGLWGSTFALPSEYRTAQAEAADPRPQAGAGGAAQSAPASACNIKGNHSRRGEWIYHLPGMPYYEQTRPEAMFCSEAEAIAAGYRRARVQQ